MRTVVITHPGFIENEALLIKQILDAGVSYVHLRKPDADECQMRKLIDAIDAELYPRLAASDFLPLAEEYGLGGVHLNARNPQPPKGWEGRVSRSCHSFGEIEKEDRAYISTGRQHYDYQFLSPIFNSVSKQGYGSRFSREELLSARERGIISERVFALSGITLDNIALIREYGFGGAALLGEPWEQALRGKRAFAGYLRRLIAATH